MDKDEVSQKVHMREDQMSRESTIVQKRAKVTGWGKVNHLLVRMYDDVIEKSENKKNESLNQNSNGGGDQRQ